MSITIETAKSYLAAGLSVLPAIKARKCPFVGKWKTWQERLPTPVEVSAWFANPHDAVCLICGKVSGNLEIIDFDHKGELFPKMGGGRSAGAVQPAGHRTDALRRLSCRLSLLRRSLRQSETGAGNPRRGQARHAHRNARQRRTLPLRSDRGLCPQARRFHSTAGLERRGAQESA